MKAGELCIRQVVTAQAGESIHDAARRMAEYDVGDLIVVEELGGEVRPIGVITDRDIVTRAVARGNVRLQELRLADVMRPSLLTAREDDDVDAVLAKLKRHAIRRIPVVDEKNRLQGILSIDDLLGWIGAQLNDANTLLERQGRGAVPSVLVAAAAGPPAAKRASRVRRASLVAVVLAAVAWIALTSIASVDRRWSTG
jgi:CBS domain-containing protein